MNRTILHLAPAQPGTSVEGTCRRLLEELGGRAIHIDLGPFFAVDPVEVAKDPERALSAAIDAVEKITQEVVVTSAQLPAALQPLAFALQARLAAELGAGMVLVTSDANDSLDQVARIAAHQYHATVVGARLADGGWVGASEASSYRLLSGEFSNCAATPVHVAPMKALVRC